MSDAPLSTSGPRTWKVTLSYDGTDFSGWQVQPGEATIQGELQSALGRITGESPLPQGSGRTDAGVHALAQVASFELAAPIPSQNLQRALNRTLPASIRVSEARTVRSAFHARHSACAKTYEYRIFRGPICPPFLSRYVYECRWPLDLDALQQAAALFTGEHDFSSFAATDPDLTARELDIVSQPASGSEPDLRAATLARSAVRIIFSSAWETRQTESGELFVYRVRGNGFLHHMVRNLVGTMLDAARGQIQIDEIKEILAARSRSAAGPTAPARGLFLHSVEYDSSDDAAIEVQAPEAAPIARLLP
jgi:tRNA pseudouridine38-40 synthase